MSDQKGILVRAVGRIGFYGGVRRYPVNPPRQRLYPADKAGAPFLIKSMDDFSDASRPLEERQGVKRSPGWMELVKTGAPVETGVSVEMLANTNAGAVEAEVKRGPGRPRRVV